MERKTVRDPIFVCQVKVPFYFHASIASVHTSPTYYDSNDSFYVTTVAGFIEHCFMQCAITNVPQLALLAYSSPSFIHFYN